MCFSASASFTASGLLAVIACAAIYSARTTAWRLVACTPLFFAIQQCMEGILWRFTHQPPNSIIIPAATYLYAFFAYVFWPVWIPYCLLLLERNTMRKKILTITIIIASIFSVLALHAISTYGIVASLKQSHIVYNTVHALPALLTAIAPYLTLLYIALVILPFFISTIPFMPLMGTVLIVACGLTHILYTQYLTSVWCFFSALLSGLLLFIVLHNQKQKK